MADYAGTYGRGWASTNHAGRHVGPWGWLWREMLFCPYPWAVPTDIGRYCHAPYSATAEGILGNLVQGSTSRGPAMQFYNFNDAFTIGAKWAWSDNAATCATGFEILRRYHFTFMATFECARTANQLYILFQVIDETNEYIAYYNPATRQFRVSKSAAPSYDVTFDSGFNDTPGDRTTHTFAMAAHYNTNATTFFADGRQVYAVAKRPLRLYQILSIRLGGSDGSKDNGGWSGAIGPFLILHTAIEESKLKRWHSDPWGFLHPGFGVRALPVEIPPVAPTCSWFDPRTGLPWVGAAAARDWQDGAAARGWHDGKEAPDWHSGRTASGWFDPRRCS